MARQGSGPLKFWVGIGLGLTLCSANAVLLIQNASLRRELASLSQQRRKTAEVALGTVLSGIAGFGEDGRHVTVDYRKGQDATVLLIYSTTCAWCTRHWPQWQSMVRGLPTGRFRAVATCLSGIAPDCFAPRFQRDRTTTLHQPDPSAILTHHLLFTPQTIVIDYQGTVRGVWTGVLDEARLRQIESTLKSCSRQAPVVVLR